MTDKDEIFNDERTLDLPPGYRTVKLKISPVQRYTNDTTDIDDVIKKVDEIIDFINLTEITVTGNDEFLDKFRKWMQ